MLYMVYGVDGPDADRIRAEQREAHFAYLAENEDILAAPPWPMNPTPARAACW